MSRIHDMGGRFGDGPVVPEPEGEVFHEDWHARALAITLAAAAHRRWNLDTMRHARESLTPAEYTALSYYEIWIAALADQLAETGLVSRDELAGGAAAVSDLAGQGLAAADVEATLIRGGPTRRDSNAAPAFRPGDAVRARRPAGNRWVAGGHTRLPSYAVGARGRVLRCHGAHVLPDAHAHGLGERPEPLYTVVFPASELWVQPEHPGDQVTLDLWQSYLEPVA